MLLDAGVDPRYFSLYSDDGGNQEKKSPVWDSWNTPRTTNMSPENQWLEDVFPIETVPF